MSRRDTSATAEPIGTFEPVATFAGRCFMETQFPVSKLSKESYAERRANQSQTITGLGKWWGRKPLVLCRAVILGLLMPASNDPQKDREVFLRLMTMDDDGMLRRKSKSISPNLIFQRLPLSDRQRYLTPDSTEEKAKYRKGVSRAEKDALQTRVFRAMSYDERLAYCERPEQVDGPDPESWKVINAHLATNASSLPDLVAELGKRRFGGVPRVGDSFCGGGSIPFEAARLGCEAYGSDLNPVAALLTWASLNIIGGSSTTFDTTTRFLQDVYDAVETQVNDMKLEQNTRGWRADAFLYCTDCTCPECRWRIPLVTTCLVGPTSGVVASLQPVTAEQRFELAICEGVDARERAIAAGTATLTSNSEIKCPQCDRTTPMRAVRGDGLGDGISARNRLRRWQNCDVVPQPEDVFGERLYCIRWTERRTKVVEKSNSESVEKEFTERHYLSPDALDLEREERVLELLMERFDEWQKKGYIPSRRIEPGAKTDEPIRTRGWTHWHHLFTPRQLLVHGMLLRSVVEADVPLECKVAGVLAVGRVADWCSRLCRWGTGAARESIAQTFSNQALNTLFSYASKSLDLLGGSWLPISPHAQIVGKARVEAIDARNVDVMCDLWITDPPYADAINYHELSEFFLAWYDKHVTKWFPTWTMDSRRALAVQGADEAFSRSMVQCYQRLVQRMPDEGMQVVMFTHQNAAVWADLAVILWAAGLCVSAAWCIQTEREAVGTRHGNYVQGTVLLVLRKRTHDEITFLDEVHHEVESEVRRQLDSMRELDDQDSPNFADTDYQLAAYAAALRVLTSKQIEDIDVERELTRVRGPGEQSPVEALIEDAVRIACDHLVPRGIEGHLWKNLTAVERLYLKSLEVESHGEHRSGVYQELARGFGVEDYQSLMASTDANVARLKTASEFGRRELRGAGFPSSLARHALFAVHRTAATDATKEGMTWLKTELKDAGHDYATCRRRLIELLSFLATFRHNDSMEHWHRDAEAATLLAGALENDTV